MVFSKKLNWHSPYRERHQSFTRTNDLKIAFVLIFVNYYLQMIFIVCMVFKGAGMLLLIIVIAVKHCHITLSRLSLKMKKELGWVLH